MKTAGLDFGMMTRARVLVLNCEKVRLDPVEEIEDFYAELYPVALCDLRRFEEREIPVIDSGAS
jgi:hypothetical protein